MERRSDGAAERQRAPSLRLSIVPAGFRSQSLILGALLSAAMAAVALLAPVIAPHDPVRVNPNAVLAPPGPAHWLGTDDIGRDVLSRILHGARTSLTLALAAVLVSSLLGSVVALVSGYWGGPIDMILMRIMDSFLAFPGLVLALAMVSFLGTSNLTIVLAVGIVATPGLARITRSQVLVERRRDFVQAATVVGATDGRILLRHILPSVASLIVVQASLNLAFAILTEASLSFLGVGAPPPAPTWGTMLRAGYSYLEKAPWVAIAPGVAIFLSVLGFNMLGDGLRAALSPRGR
jgi:ABC-type dipeptide/oligopeptide/nickel transport system permease subunit